MTWVAAGVASGAATMAVVQRIKAKKDAKKDEKNRPVYEIPDEIKQNLSQAQQQALQGLPEEQKQQFISNLQRGTSYGLSQMGSRKSGIAGIAALNENQNQGYQNLLSMDAQARQQNQQQLYGMRQNVADYKDQAFQSNKLNPYYEGIAKRSAADAALVQNFSNAGQMAGGMNFSGKSKTTSQNNYGNMYNYNPNNNPTGIIPDGKQDMSSYS